MQIAVLDIKQNGLTAPSDAVTATVRARAFPVLRPRRRFCAPPGGAPVWQSVEALSRPGRRASLLSGCPRVPTDPLVTMTVFDDGPVAVSAHGIAPARRAPPRLLCTPQLCRVLPSPPPRLCRTR